MFEQQPTTTETHSGGGFKSGFMLFLLALALGGGGVYALSPKAVPPPTAEEILATMPTEEATARKEYAALKKKGHTEAAEAFAKSKSLPIALTAVEAMHAPTEEPQPEANEAQPEGNVQAPN